MVVAAGVCYAVAVMLWVPYLLTGLLIISSRLLVRDVRSDWRDLLWNGTIIVAVAGIIVLSAYAAVAWLSGITSISAWLSWMRSATHGEARDRQLLRMGFGLPRSFFVMGDHGTLWKQFLFRDPYAAVTIREVALSGAAVAVFYVAGGMFAAALWWSHTGRRLLLWSVATVAPTLLLALLYEAGSVERYLAIYPVVFVCAAYLLTKGACPQPISVGVMVAAAILIGHNTLATARSRVDTELETAVGRAQAFRSKNVVVGVVSIRDPLIGFYLARNDDPRMAALPSVFPVVPALASQIGGSVGGACCDAGGWC